MKAVSSGPPATPRGRRWQVNAYLRMAASLLLAGAIAGVLSWRFTWERYWMEFHGQPGPERLIEVVGYEFYQPLVFALDEYLIARFTYEPILAVLVGGLVCVVVLEAHER